MILSPCRIGNSRQPILSKVSNKKNIFVIKCDNLIDQEYEKVYHLDKENGIEILTLAAIKNYCNPYSTLKTAKNAPLKSMKKKPDLTIYVNAGVYLP